MICKENNLLHNNLGIKENNLTFAGYDTVALAKKYGTPLMLLDENKIRNTMRTYKSAMQTYFGNDSVPLYASKALSFVGIYQIAKEEGINTDIVSIGELYTAIKAGFPLERAFFHGNCKTDYDIEYAIDNGIGFFNVDTYDELYAINKIAGSKGIKQKILLRLTPGIDPHTHAAISTGNERVVKGIKGIGKMTAQRIIVDLRDKIVALGIADEIPAGGSVAMPVNNAVKDEAVSALTMLGFAPAPSQKVVLAILQEQPDAPVEQVVKMALKQIK